MFSFTPCHRNTLERGVCQLCALICTTTTGVLAPPVVAAHTCLHSRVFVFVVDVNMIMVFVPGPGLQGDSVPEMLQPGCLFAALFTSICRVNGVGRYWACQRKEVGWRRRRWWRQGRQHPGVVLGRSIRRCGEKLKWMSQVVDESDL